VTGSGGAKCWGSNFQGQLGDGTTTDHGTPVDVSGLNSGVAVIASGLNVRTCVIAAAARVMCWGRGRLTPTAVSGLGADVTAITTACALSADGAVKCWGDNLAAVAVPGLDRGVAAIASSGTHNCALMSLGGVKCWGLNNHGQLGDGTKEDRATPVDVGALHGPAAAIATGAFHTCAVLRSGGIDCWGSNETGALGDGTTVDRAHPVAVESFGTAKASLAIVSRSVRVTRARVAPVIVRCGSHVLCRGTVTLRVGSTRLGSRAFAIAADATEAIRAKLTPRGFRMLTRAKRLSTHVAVTGGVKATRTVTLVAP
jgi:hypothetical protein